MKLLKSAILILISLLILQGCSLSFLDSADDEINTEASEYSVYDSATDIKYYYDGEDNLLWYETYDFNALGQIIFIKHFLSTDTVLWSYVYEWSGDNIVNEAYFSGNNTLSWYNIFNYNSGNMVKQVNYNGSDELQWFKSITYSGSGKEIQIAKFNGFFELEWAYKYEYDGSDRLSVSSAYDSSQSQTASISYDYDAEDQIIKKTGAGSTTSTDTFSAGFSGFSHPTTGGVNTENRNVDGLESPSSPATPLVPSLTLSDQAMNYTWMNMWIYTNFGYSFVTLNSDFLPVYMKTEAPDYLDDKAIEVDLTYDGIKVLTKTTTYNNLEVLKLEFVYDYAGYLISMDTTGASLYIPLRYDFTYLSGIPESISISNNDTLLQKFEYTYVGDIDLIDPEEFAKSSLTIKHYDGDNTYIAYYTFTYSIIDSELTIDVMDPKGNDNPADDSYNGKFILSYDTNDNVAGFASYDKFNNPVWNYKYGYDDLQNRISETRLDVDDVPEVVYTFDVESLFEDLRRFLPLP
jgi:hypothetical protein